MFPSWQSKKKRTEEKLVTKTSIETISIIFWTKVQFFFLWKAETLLLHLISQLTRLQRTLWRLWGGKHGQEQHPLSPFLHLLANVLAHSFATLTPNKSMNHIFSGRNYILDNCLNTPICHTRPWLQHLNKVETIWFKDCFHNSSHSGQRTSHAKGQCLSRKCWRNLNSPMAHIHNYPIGISNNDCKSCGLIIWWVVGAITVQFPTPVGGTFPFVVITIPYWTDWAISLCISRSQMQHPLWFWIAIGEDPVLIPLLPMPQ